MGVKAQKERDEGLFLFFLPPRVMTSRVEYHLRRHAGVRKPSSKADPCLGPHRQRTSWDLLSDSSPCELPQGRRVATGHTSQAGEGRQQPFYILPVVSGQLASPPTMLCIYPTSKARAAIKGRKKTEMKLTLSPHLSLPALLEILLCQNVN